MNKNIKADVGIVPDIGTCPGLPFTGSLSGHD